MEVVTGFWASAVRRGVGLDFGSMAQLMGGYPELECADAAQLMGMGVSMDDAIPWNSDPDLPTKFSFVTLADASYPAALRRLPDAPPVLFFEGNLSILGGACVSVVGTRQCTAYGAGVARHLSSLLSEQGVVVVSGLARGIDAHAHEAAANSGNTVAVLAHGLSHTAPASNRGLRRRIVDNGGLLVSSWQDDVPPRPFRFPLRNRWIAALGSVVVVVEAARKSGAKITAEQAWSMDTRVVVVPGGLGASASQGCLDLLTKGADVMSGVAEFVRQVCDTVVTDKDWHKLLFSGMSVTQVSRVTGRPLTELFRELSRAEVAGEVVRLPGQRYARGTGEENGRTSGSEA